MATAGTPAFSGARPKVAAHLLDDANASGCLDIYLGDGLLRPLPGLLADGSFGHTPQRIWKWEDGEFWISTADRSYIARSVNPAVDRLYISGALGLRVGNIGTAPGAIFYGPAPYPKNTFRVGVPAPSNAPAVSITNLEPDTTRDYEALDQETRFYVYTVVNEWGEESAPSPVSSAVVCYNDSHCAVTVSVTGTADYVPLSLVRIYRTNTGTEATAFQYVTEVSLAAAGAPIADQVKSEYLAEVMETGTWQPPPLDVKYITLVAGDFYAGVSGREVCLSESRVPYAWPLEYRFPLEDPPVGLASNGVELVALTKGRPVIFTGNAPQAVQMVRLADYQPCMNEASICVFGGEVVYASPDGLIGISSSQGFRNLTDGIWTRAQWQAFNPSSVRLTVFENLLWMTCDTGGYLIDLASQSASPTTLTFDCAHYDGYSDTLYIAKGANRYKVGQGSVLPYLWYSKTYLLPGTNYCSARVHALTYNDLVFDLYVDGQRVFRGKPRDAEPFRLPAIRGRTAWFVLSGTDTVRSASMATSPGELIL